MSRAWKPGDVAIFRTAGGVELTVFRYHDIDNRSDEWMSATEGGAYPLPADNVRPLVVIDPEDREQVEQLAEAIVTPEGRVEPSMERFTDKVAAALREFADPTPEFDEPTTVGSLVREDGEIWVRTAWATWRCITTADVAPRWWHEFTAPVVEHDAPEVPQ